MLGSHILPKSMKLLQRTLTKTRGYKCWLYKIQFVQQTYAKVPPLFHSRIGLPLRRRKTSLARNHRRHSNDYVKRPPQRRRKSHSIPAATERFPIANSWRPIFEFLLSSSVSTRASCRAVEASLSPDSCPGERWGETGVLSLEFSHWRILKGGKMSVIRFDLLNAPWNSFISWYFVLYLTYLSKYM